MVPMAPSTTWTRPSASSSRRVGTLALVVEVGGQPALHRGHVQPLSPRVVLDLVALDLADAEVLRLRPPEVVPADRRAGQHRVALGQRDPGIGLGAEQIEHGLLLGVVGARRISWRRTDALVLLPDQVG